MNGIEALWSLPLARTVAWALTHFLWQGVVVGILLSGALALVGKNNASLRYAVSVQALVLLSALPVITFFWLAQSGELQTPTDSESHALTFPAKRLKAEADSAHVAAVGSQEILPWFLAVWMLGVAVLSVYNLGGWIQARRLRNRGTRPIPAHWERVVDELRRRLGIGRVVQILETSRLSVPAVVGWFRPVILVPAGVLTGLTPQQLEAILAHELAHVRRHDYLVNLLQTVVETLLFYHPVVWWVSRVIRQERENCCDDLAVTLCRDRMVYARALAELERLRAVLPRLVLASASGPLLTRIRRITKFSTQPSLRSWLAGVLALGLLPLGVLHLSFVALSEYKALGFGNLPREELIELASHGVTPEYIREWRRAGYPARQVRDRDDLREYAYSLKELREHGITVGDFRKMMALGYYDPHLLKAQGITLDYIQDLADFGYRGLSRKQLVRFRNDKINGRFIQELFTLGYRRLRPDDLIALREDKIDAAFIREARAREGRNLSVAELVKLRQEARLQETITEESWMGGS